MAQLDEKTAQALAASGALTPELAQQFSVPASLQPNPVVPEQASPPVVDIGAQVVPDLKPTMVPGTSPLAPPPEYISQSELLPPGATLADISQVPQGQSILSTPQTGATPVADPIVDTMQQTALQSIAQKSEDQALQQHAEAKGQQSAKLKAEASDAEAANIVNAKTQQAVEESNAAGHSSLRSIMQNGSLGQKFAAVLAVMAGGVGAALTGGPNQSLVMFDKMLSEEMERQKFTEAQKDQTRRAALEEAELRLKQAAQKTDSEYKKSQIQQNLDEITMKRQQMQQSLVEQVQAKEASKVLESQSGQVAAATPQIAAKNRQLEDALNFYETTNPKKADGIREKLIVLPNGEMQIAKADSTRVREFEKTIRAPNESAINTLEKIRQFAKQASSLSLEDRAKMQTELNLAAGKLRIPITGPGAMTEDEYKRLLNTLGDPTKIFSINSIERLKLDTVMNNLKSDLKLGAAQIGVRWPQDREEMLRDKLAAKGYNSQQIEAALKARK
jgi:hypothetical protein